MNDVSVTMKVVFIVVSQDLLTPTAEFGGEPMGLNIRENPSSGFFVVGLREYVVRSHQEVRRRIGRGRRISHTFA